MLVRKLTKLVLTSVVGENAKSIRALWSCTIQSENMIIPIRLYFYVANNLVANSPLLFFLNLRIV